MLLNNSIQLFTDVFLSPQLNLKNKTQLSKHLLLHSSLLAGKQKDKKQKEKPKPVLSPEKFNKLVSIATTAYLVCRQSVRRAEFPIDAEVSVKN